MPGLTAIIKDMVKKVLKPAESSVAIEVYVLLDEKSALTRKYPLPRKATLAVWFFLSKGYGQNICNLPIN